MTDMPKKPRAKKSAAPKEAAPKKEGAARADAPADAQTKSADASADAQRSKKESVLLAALPHAAFDGFTATVLEKAGAEAGLSATETARLFENGPIGLIEFYSHWADSQMEQTLAGLNLPAMKIRERIAAAVKARLAALRPHKEAARRAAALLSLPMHMGLASRLMYRTVDAMWRAAGDTSTDFNFYTKRGILAGVYGATAMRWFTDTSDDEKATDEFLAARIDNVMQFEKFKAKARDALANFPIFADLTKNR